MTSFSKFQQLSLLSVGSLALISICYSFETVFSNYYYEKLKTKSTLPFSKWDHNWDRRDAQSTIKPTKHSHTVNRNLKNRNKAVHHVILVRHGQYNTHGKTDDERSLTNLGQLQAEVTGMRLAEINVPYSVIVRSTMKRAQETSKLIEQYLPKVPVIDDCLLMEGSPIPPDPPSGHWKSEKTFFQDGPRIEAAFRKYIHRVDNLDEKDVFTIIVCHANVIRYFVCRALQFPPEAWLRMSLNHGSITWFSISSSGRVVLRSFGETGHMIPQWITSS